MTPIPLSCGSGAGPRGAAGPAGAQGDQGDTGPAGPAIEIGDTNCIDLTLTDGVLTADLIFDPASPAEISCGPDGISVECCAAASGEYAEFFALMPGDNASTVALAGFVDFPQDGPASGGIVRAGADTFTLPNIGTYQVEFQVSVDEPGQLVLALDPGAGFLAEARTTVGRATGTTQIVGQSLIVTTVINTLIAVQNPAGNAAALTITPLAGGASSVSANLIIKQIA